MRQERAQTTDRILTARGEAAPHRRFSITDGATAGLRLATMFCSRLSSAPGGRGVRVRTLLLGVSILSISKDRRERRLPGAWEEGEDAPRRRT